MARTPPGSTSRGQTLSKGAPFPPCARSGYPDPFHFQKIKSPAATAEYRGLNLGSMVNLPSFLNNHLVLSGVHVERRPGTVNAARLAATRRMTSSRSRSRGRPAEGCAADRTQRSVRRALVRRPVVRRSVRCDGPGGGLGATVSWARRPDSDFAQRRRLPGVGTGGPGDFLPRKPPDEMAVAIQVEPEFAVVTCPPETGPDPALGSWTKGHSVRRRVLRGCASQSPLRLGEGCSRHDDHRG